MKIPLIKPRLFVTVKKPGGKIILDAEVPCHSYTWNFYIGTMGVLFGLIKDIAYGTYLIDTSGTQREDDDQSPYVFSTLANDLASVGVDTVGLLVGKGTAAWALKNYALAEQITNGIGSGKLSHGQQVAATVATAGADRTVTSMRSFYNNSSSAAITVYEVAKYVEMYAGGTQRQCMIFRDLLDTPIVVPTGGGELQVKLQSTLTYPTTIS